MNALQLERSGSWGMLYTTELLPVKELILGIMDFTINTVKFD